MFLEGRAVVLFELRIKTGFDRVESQQQGREAVDRPNVTPLDLPERFVSAAVDFLLAEMIKLDQRAKLGMDLGLLDSGRLFIQTS